MFELITVNQYLKCIFEFYFKIIWCIVKLKPQSIIDGILYLIKNHFTKPWYVHIP